VAVRSRYPFFYSLLNYNLLFLAREQGKTDYDTAKTLDRALDPRRGHLQPLPQILGLARKELLDSAKLRVPLFQRLSLFRGIYYTFQRLWRGLQRAFRGGAGAAGRPDRHRASAAPGSQRRPEAPQGGAPGEAQAGRGAALGAPGVTTLRPSSPSQLAAYRKALQSLSARFLGPNKTMNEGLEELVEKWNPLYDPQARAELNEDVNAMVRDYFRNIKRTFRVSLPTPERIRHLAGKLAENKAFARISKKDYFTRYIELYMLKLLGER
jgi:hypothetical protein